MGSLKNKNIGSFLDIFKNTCYEYLDENNKNKMKEVLNMLQSDDKSYAKEITSTSIQNIEDTSLVKFDHYKESKDISVDLNNGLINILKDGIYAINFLGTFDQFTCLVLCKNNEELFQTYTETEELYDDLSNKIKHYLNMNRVLNLQSDDVISIKNITRDSINTSEINEIVDKNAELNIWQVD